ncbi:hypothetical protein KFE25_008842 [Diacronema lutheri]|uniref:30S ribosomal protein S20 n=1 Tax=Diacronema lutheri TaxID=2081491 RepID=A0A8J6CGS2_DIALT|nr:hypothetical protein KFE25_008842 [Diacronema lutheri]
MSRVLALLPLLAATAVAFSGVAPPRAVHTAAQCRSLSAVVMSDTPAKKYRPTSFGVNPRVYKDRKANLYNRYYKSTQATALKKVAAALASGDAAAAGTAFSLATSVIDKNVKRGIIHRNKGARQKSRTQKRLSALVAAAK